MEYRRLGASGLKVSPICLGTMMFGERTDRRTAARIVGSAFDAGVNFIDTADAYGEGESERVVGNLVRGNRDRWVLATKLGNLSVPGDPNSGGLGRKWMMRAVEGSLKRLGTDYIDIYYFHREDRDTPLAEALRAMDDLMRQGKVRYFGVSNFQGWRMAEVVRECRSLGLPQPIVCQPYYNALNRQAEVEVLPACRHYGLGVVPYSALARGVLTGKYRPGAKPPRDSRAGRGEQRFLQTDYRKESLDIAQQVRRHAERKGTTAGQFAFNWVLANAIVTAALVGPRTFEQWREYLGALQHGFDAEDEAFIDGLVPAGHASTPGYTDPRFPVTGRVPLE
ncbi:MAG: aldo/keto reductase [Betaproteobacteria bacterium]|nr:aldo/keto reductase [Betaproteobacteria bacterium]MBI3937746.1 aldo/keto reductase [Betaproteobacteria bacterium]